MTQSAFLTPHQLVARWNGVVTTGTLANWRSKRVGPTFTKLRGRVLYATSDVEAYEQRGKLQANDNGPLAVCA